MIQGEVFPPSCFFSLVTVCSAVSHSLFDKWTGRCCLCPSDPLLCVSVLIGDLSLAKAATAVAQTVSWAFLEAFSEGRVSLFWHCGSSILASLRRDAGLVPCFFIFLRVNIMVVGP